MRAAPAVDAPLSDARAARRLVLLLHLGAAAALLAWAASWPLEGLALRASDPVVAAAVLLLTLVAAGLGQWQSRRLFDRRPRRLAWDGTAWRLHQPEGVRLLVEVRLQIDLGPALLLRLDAARPQPGATAVDRSSASCWVWATARAAGADWHGLRVALRQHAGLLSPPSATSPGAPA